MALPVAAFVGKGVALIKGLSAAKLAKAGVAVVSAGTLAKTMSKKEKNSVEKESKKKGLGVNFDMHFQNDIRINNKRQGSSTKQNYKKFKNSKKSKRRAKK